MAELDYASNSKGNTAVTLGTIGTLPFPVDLPMGLGFTLRFNKQDLSDFYSAVKRYEVTP